MADMNIPPETGAVSGSLLYPNWESGDWTPDWAVMHEVQAMGGQHTRNTSSGDYDLVSGNWVPRAATDPTTGAVTTPPPYWQALNTMGVGVGPRGPNGTNRLPGDPPVDANGAPIAPAAPGMAVRSPPAASLAGMASSGGGGGGAASAGPGTGGGPAIDNETQRSIPQQRSLLDMLPANWRQLLSR